jgi:indoleamine 2,3-dioxygenase
MQISKLLSQRSPFLLKQTSLCAQANFSSTFTNKFKLLEEMTKEEQEKTPMFTVSKEFGFLPRKHPIRDLPPKYEVVNKLLKAATIH